MSCSLAPGTQVSSSANLCNQVEALEAEAEAQREVHICTDQASKQKSRAHAMTCYNVTKKGSVEEGS